MVRVHRTKFMSSICQGKQIKVKELQMKNREQVNKGKLYKVLICEYGFQESRVRE